MSEQQRAAATRRPIVGIGATEFSKDSGRSELRLAVEAVEAAIADAGLEPADDRRHGHLHRGHQPRDRDRPQPRHRRAVVLLPHPPRRRRRLRHRPAGGAGRARRRRRRTSSATGRSTSARGTASARACRAARRSPTAEQAHFAWYAPFGLLTPAQWVAMFATRYMHEYGATSEDFGRVAVADRKHAATNPKAWFYEQPITLEEHQAVALDRRAAAPARLLPGERRRPGDRRHVGRAGARPAASARRSSTRRRRARATNQDMMTSYYRDSITGLPEMGLVARQLWNTTGLGPDRHPDRGHLRPLHAARAAAARGVRLLRAGRGQGLHRRRQHRARRRPARSTPTAGSSVRRTSTA